MPPAICRGCGWEFVQAEDVEGKDHRPRPGDVSVCGSCGTMSVFDDRLLLRAPRPGELEHLQAKFPKPYALVEQALDAARRNGPIKQPPPPLPN